MGTGVEALPLIFVMMPFIGAYIGIKRGAFKAKTSRFGGFVRDKYHQMKGDKAEYFAKVLKELSQESHFGNVLNQVELYLTNKHVFEVTDLLDARTNKPIPKGGLYFRCEENKHVYSLDSLFDPNTPYWCKECRVPGRDTRVYYTIYHNIQKNDAANEGKTNADTGKTNDEKNKDFDKFMELCKTVAESTETEITEYEKLLTKVIVSLQNRHFQHDIYKIDSKLYDKEYYDNIIKLMNKYWNEENDLGDEKDEQIEEEEEEQTKDEDVE